MEESSHNSAFAQQKKSKKIYAASVIVVDSQPRGSPGPQPFRVEGFSSIYLAKSKNVLGRFKEWAAETYLPFVRKCLRPLTFLLISHLLIEDMRLLQHCAALMRKHEKQCVLLASEVEWVETRNHFAGFGEELILHDFECVLHRMYD
jgi:hypothetical protein